MSKHPVIELMETPSFPMHQLRMQPLDFQPAKQIAKRHSRRTCVPIHVPSRPGGGESHSVLKFATCSIESERAIVQAAVDPNPMRAP